MINCKWDRLCVVWCRIIDNMPFGANPVWTIPTSRRDISWRGGEGKQPKPNISRLVHALGSHDLPTQFIWNSLTFIVFGLESADFYYNLSLAAASTYYIGQICSVIPHTLASLIPSPPKCGGLFHGRYISSPQPLYRICTSYRWEWDN